MIVELRRYRLRPGRRDELIELFDRELVETQEAVGMRVIGQFRDIDAPDEFVWMRAFESMEARPRALAAFYDGLVWRRHGPAANATMVDSDDVLLLRPAGDRDAWTPAGTRTPAGTTGDGPGAVLVRVVPLAAPTAEPPVGTPVMELVSEPGPNNYPRLPVREDARVRVTVSALTDVALAREVARTDGLARLVPTARSLLHG